MILGKLFIAKSKKVRLEYPRIVQKIKAE